MQFLFLREVDPTSYQILNNLKIIATGILFRVFLKRPLTRAKWGAIVLLAVGATVSQLGSCEAGGGQSPRVLPRRAECLARGDGGSVLR